MCNNICKALVHYSYILKTVPSFVKGGGKCNMHRVRLGLNLGEVTRFDGQVHLAGLPGGVRQIKEKFT